MTTMGASVSLAFRPPSLQCLLPMVFSCLLAGATGCGGDGGNDVIAQPLCLQFAASGASSGATVALTSGSDSGCEYAVLDVMGSAIGDVYAVSFDLEFDATQFEYLGASASGSALAQGGSGVDLLESREGGTVTLGVTRLGGPQGVDLSNSRILTVRFRRLSPQSTSTLTLSEGAAYNSAVPPTEITAITWLGGRLLSR